MKIRFILPCALAAALATSCTPYKDGPNQDGPNHGPHEKKTVTDKEQQKIKEQREQMAREDELKKKQEQQAQGGDTAVTNTPDKPLDNPTPNPEPPKPPAEKKTEYPFASRVPGKEGFVFSPYNNKMIDVRDIPSGTLVRDPTYQAAEKKFFRVP